MVFRPGHRRAFTLIELLVAMLIVALVFGIGVPNLLRRAGKDPLNQATSDLIDAFREARGRAVLSGNAHQVLFNASSRSFRVEPAPTGGRERQLNILEQAHDMQREARGEKPPAIFEATFHEELLIQKLVVNTRLPVGDVFAVRFYPNGVCDQFEAVLSWGIRSAQRVTLEVTTSIPEVESGL